MSVIDTIIAIIGGFLAGLVWILWKKKTLKATILFFAVLWVILKIFRYITGPSHIQAFMSLVALFAIIGAVAAFFINKYLIKEKGKSKSKKKK